jgi:hypothetical protein
MDRVGGRPAHFLEIHNHRVGFGGRSLLDGARASQRLHPFQSVDTESSEIYSRGI